MGRTRHDYDKTFTLKPIGYVERDKSHDALRGKALREQPARIALDPAVTDALLGLRLGSNVLVLCYFDRSDRDVLQVHPRGNMDNPLRGVFATRSPARPNPIAVTSARVQRIEENVLYVVGLDALDGTPVIDIKSHSESFDTPYEG
ncbi:MAG: tRNA (N6-threonylcarbamoyladenosine(37)-N6)-methyltransferase TrmO [Anaerolineae bacterium]|nr:tRNA (N6-threonylcarbamoyladenosine(37)-N6)-methyltransferase TrmO [Anaerolineae bacterium]